MSTERFPRCNACSEVGPSEYSSQISAVSAADCSIAKKKRLEPSRDIIEDPPYLLLSLRFRGERFGIRHLQFCYVIASVVSWLLTAWLVTLLSMVSNVIILDSNVSNIGAYPVLWPNMVR